MHRRCFSSAIAILLIVVVLAGFALSCGGRSQGKGNFYNLRKLDLRQVDKKHVLEVARNSLLGKPVSNEAERFPVLYNNEPRGVFLTLVRPNEAALTAFGFGDSVIDATKRAADVLRRLAEGEDLAKLKLRIDIVDESTDEQEIALDKKMGGRGDFSLRGIIFDTNPMAAFLPTELRDWGVVDKKAGYRAVQMRKLLKQRKLGRVLNEQLDENKKVRSAYFTTISFLEGEGGEPVALFRGNLLEGFDPTPDRLLTAIRAAGEYLKQAVREDGSFVYLYYPQTSHASKSYNELRHAGTTFAMCQIYEITKDPALLAAIKRALAYLDKTSLGPDPADAGRVDFRAVAEPQRLYSKLGGTGLALLAFGKYTEVTGDQQYLELMRAYGRFIEFMQESNGDMRMRYWRSAGEKERDVEDVLYYPGEAFFGLAKLYGLDGRNERWKKVAIKGIDFIVNTRDANLPTNKLEPDHWLMYAINEWYRVQPQSNHLAHAKRLVDGMLANFNARPKYPDFAGGFSERPQTTPTACRLEGLAAIYRLAEHIGDAEEMKRIYDVLGLGASFLMRNQYNSVNTMFFQNPEKAIGGYMMSYWAPEIQIDFVQHSTSALIGIREVLMKRAQQVNQQQTPLPNAA